MPDDYACLGALEAASELGLRVPEDLSLGGYDGMRLAQHIRPRLTTIAQNASQIGMLAARRLVDAIECAPPKEPWTTTVPGQLLAGESMGPISHA